MPQKVYRMPSLSSIAQSDHYRSVSGDVKVAPVVSPIEVVVQTPEVKVSSRVSRRILRAIHTTIQITFNAIGFFILFATFVACVSLTSFLLIKIGSVAEHSTMRTQVVPSTSYSMSHGETHSNISSISK